MTSRPAAVPVVAIGASSGGIEALWGLLAALPPTLDAAVLVVLHTPAHGESNLDRVLAQRSALPVRFVEDGETLAPGTVVLPRPDRHLMLDGTTLRSANGPKECRVRPAINVLFRSVAESVGRRAIGVVLSGSLDDGTAGLWAIQRQGGLAFVQDPGDALFDSMPLSALEHVAADGVASAPQLAPLVARAVSQFRAAAAVDAPAAEGAGELGIESRLAVGASVGIDAVYTLGRPSRYACPECHGVLSQIEEGRILRFRCHTGHGYSLQTLAAALDRDVDDSLLNARRALEEKIMLIERASPQRPAGLDSAPLARARERLDALRTLLRAS